MDPLEEYIKKELGKGFSKREIYNKLIATGYKAEKIRPLFEKFSEESYYENKKWIAIALIIFIVIGISFSVLYFLDFSEETAKKTTLLPEDYDFDQETGMIRVKEKYLPEQT